VSRDPGFRVRRSLQVFVHRSHIVDAELPIDHGFSFAWEDEVTITRAPCSVQSQAEQSGAPGALREHRVSSAKEANTSGS
jgi:hypothetical protein